MWESEGPLLATCNGDGRSLGVGRQNTSLLVNVAQQVIHLFNLFRV